MNIFSNYIESVGNTPIIKLNSDKLKINSNVFVKLEGANPGGTHKSRVGLSMILDAEEKGILTRGSDQTIVEPTGGNTGIALAIAAAVFGYSVVFVVPDNYSQDNKAILKLLNADLIISDSSKGANSNVELMWDILIDNPGYVYLNQFENPANVDAHRNHTAQEILRTMQRVDYFVCGIGTGGSITGIGEELKKHFPNVKVIGVQPEGCDFLNNKFCDHKIQGLAPGFVPAILNKDIIDSMISVSYEDAIATVRNVAINDGMLLGISSGAYIRAAIELAATIPDNSEILTISPDFGHSYLSEINS